MTTPTFPTEKHSTLNLSRQFLIMKGVSDLNFVVIGAGGIGSNAAYMLACLGAETILVFDDDVVGEENIAPAFYGKSDIGKPKVHALRDRILDMTGTEIQAMNRKFDAEFVAKHESGIPFTDIIVVTVDGLDKRREVWELGHDIFEWLYWIDARMGGPVCSAITIPQLANLVEYRMSLGELEDDEYEKQIHQATLDTPKILESYKENWLFGKNAEQPCGEKATAFITKGSMQGLIGESIYCILNHLKVPLEQVRDASQSITITSWLGDKHG